MMDVDLLRPGTVPISPDTVLWFEFLLNPSLLKNHISKNLPDPSPTDLMIKFMSMNADSRETEVRTIDLESGESSNIKQYPFKCVALKILSLKIGAYFKWDLDILEIKLPLPMQLTFLQDLFYVTGDFNIELPGRPEFDITTVSDQFLFTLVLYHRWHIRAIVNKALNNKQSKPQFIHIPGIQEPTYVAPALVDDIMRKIEANVQHSVQVLNQVIQLKEIKPKLLTFDTFQILTEDSSEIKQNWENMQEITVEEFKCQIHYDLATIYLLREEYDIAKYHITQARDLFTTLAQLNTEMSYCRVQKDGLDGYCLATNVAVVGVGLSLTQQLHNSIKNKYTDILDILKADNIAREIPMIYRDNLELDIEAGVANNKINVPKDLLLNIQCLNLVRKILDNNVVQGNYVTEIKRYKSVSLDILFPAIDSVLESASATDKQRIARYLLYLITMTDSIELSQRILANDSYKSLFDDEQLEEIKTQATPEVTELPPLLLNNDWGVSLTTYNQSKKFHIFELERRLIHSYDPVEIRELLIMLDRQNPMNPPSRAKSRWEIPIPLQSVVSALPRGLYQDYAFILLAKSRELTSAKNLKDAKALLNAIEDEIQVHVATQNPSLINTSFKLSKMISWELILVEILQYYNLWNANLTINSTVDDCNLSELVDKCKQCLANLQATDQAIPRQEIIEYCVVFLLNMAEWDYLCGLEKRWSHCEFAAAISSVCQEVVKLKGTRKFPREAWDMLLVTFGPTRDLPQKRSNNSGNITGSSTTTTISGSSSGGTKDVMNNIITGTLLRLREPTALAVAISLLARIHNVLRDESSLELYTQYLTLWPASISNANSYNIRTISEFLLHLLTQALKCYPTNVHFLRVMGDLNFILGYHESAMKYYLEAIMVESSLFSQRVPGHLQPIYRMIKCCAHLQCYTQATVLCQFLEEINYTLAFKMASSDPKTCASTDAMDAYYHCIWDTTILEFLIHLHSKRGEHHRKQLAIKVIGLLELNSNNNDEIQREAANIRKARFFRALAKQYVY
ncbi:integrator complex subunit 8 [Microplitis mediator]|uniref:integrator complex subunit 8 n=1 Tax=Microplitis mediator TaxID=375433 RepID=UPI002552BBD5|nr:integrator complex subunit 8 [Microplitis mediator]